MRKSNASSFFHFVFALLTALSVALTPASWAADDAQKLGLKTIDISGNAKPAATAPAAPAPQSLDGNLQSLKRDVLDINKELLQLEEELLFPASTQLNIFVSVDAASLFSIDGVSLKLNDKNIGNYLYTPRELEALKRGAVQRLYTGNIKNGDHELVAVITGKGPQNRDYRRAVSVAFNKQAGTKYLELKIMADANKQEPVFEFKEWE
ncbi:MAG TPA: AraC family transcriptional regulator [Pseudomonadales bacterium]|nr:AraC family transcriptional regulator [Pseudomonadales bacterium]